MAVAQQKVGGQGSLQLLPELELSESVQFFWGWIDNRPV